MGKCLQPSLAIQYKEGEKPVFLHSTHYESHLKYHTPGAKVLLIPCGKCVNCLKKKSQEWTSRLLKEMEAHPFSYFITLTYDDKHVKELNKRDIQLFLKRYREKFNVNLKYYICGEHGETTGRSHYHAIFFQDKEIPGLKFYANNLFISEEFGSCWKLGNCVVSKQVNERSIKYTIAYTLKKLGEEKLVMMSKGIGLDYLRVHKEDIKEHDGFFIHNGFKQNPPFYFKRKLKESLDPEDIKYIQEKENEVHGSVKLSGTTIPDLIKEHLQTLSNLTLKGKGDF